jgi:hypothetical protein
VPAFCSSESALAGALPAFRLRKGPANFFPAIARSGTSFRFNRQPGQTLSASSHSLFLIRERACLSAALDELGLNLEFLIFNEADFSLKGLVSGQIDRDFAFSWCDQ